MHVIRPGGNDATVAALGLPTHGFASAKVLRNAGDAAMCAQRPSEAVLFYCGALMETPTDSLDRAELSAAHAAATQAASSLQ